MRPGGKLPFFSERVRGTVTIASRYAKRRLVPLVWSGREMKPIDLAEIDGRYKIELPAIRGSHWYYLTAEQPPMLHRLKT